MRRRNRWWSLTFVAGLGTLSSGCLFLGHGITVCSQIVSTGYTTTICEDRMAASHINAFTDCNDYLADASGCLPSGTTITAQCSHLEHYDISSIVPCTLPNSLTRVCWGCADPLLVEVPFQWAGLQGRWRSLATSDSGNVRFTSSFGLAPYPGMGPVVTDPGMVAYLLELDGTPIADDSLTFVFRYDSGGIDNACLKGIDVGVISAEGMPVAMVPLSAPSFDFRQIQRPGPSTLCLGPDTVTTTRHRTWGNVKTLYR